MTDQIERCPVCDDRQSIVLPLSYPARVSEEPEAMLRPVCRTFPCPECSAKMMAPYTRMGAMKVMNFMDAERMSEDSKQWWREHAKKYMGRMIAEKLIEEGFIQFEKLEPDAYHPEGIQATIRAILPKDVAEFEERVAERQMEVAEEVASEAQRLICNWGSHYGWADIQKSQAYVEIGEALRMVKAKRGER